MSDKKRRGRRKTRKRTALDRSRSPDETTVVESIDSSSRQTESHSNVSHQPGQSSSDETNEPDSRTWTRWRPKQHPLGLTMMVIGFIAWVLFLTWLVRP